MLILRHPLSFFACFLLCISAAPASAEPELVRTVEGISEYRLTNGLQLLLFPDGSRPTVTVNMTVLVGSRHEGGGEGGMAHLLEHMVFKGTPTHSDIPRLLQERGARFNGTTSSDRTNYYETLAANGDNLEFAIRLEADRLVNSLIRGEDLASEMTVVRNEFERSENSPSNVLRQKLMSAAYEWHNYGKPTIGNRSDIERVPVENLRTFYRKYYQPDNVMLVVAGRFKTEQALELVEKYFGAIPKPERTLPQTYTEEPPQDGERTVVLRRVGDVGVVAAAYHIPAAGHDDFAALDVLGDIIARPPAGRLYKALVEPGKAASVFGGAMSQHDPGMFFVMSMVRPEKSLDEAKVTLVESLESFSASEITTEELERAKRNLLNSHERAMADSSRLAISLSSWRALGDWRLLFLNRDRIEQVTVEDVRRVAERYLRPTNRTLGLYYPTQEPMRVAIPVRRPLSEVLADLKERETVAAGEVFNATPAAIEERTTRTTLEGLKVALLPKKNRGETVRLQLTLRFGDADSLKGKLVATRMLPALMVRGTKQLSRQQLQDELDKNRAQLRGSGGTGTASFSLQTKRAHLAETVRLLRDVLRTPSLPEDEFEVIKQQRLAGLEGSLTDPQALASTRLERTMWPYQEDDVRYTPTLKEQLQRIQDLKVEDIRQVYQEDFGPSAGELVVVGDFDPDEVMELATQLVGDWQGGAAYQRIERPAMTGVAGTRLTINTPDKANAVYLAGFVLPMRDDHPDFAALTLGNSILGSSGLSSRLGNRVRQQEGLSYSVRSTMSASSLDARAEFGVYAISNPANAEKVRKAIREELDRIVKGGVTREELDEAKRGYLQRQELARNSDRTLISILAGTLIAERDMSFFAERDREVSELTIDDVAAVLKQYLDPDRLVVIAAGDFEKGGE